MQIVEAFDLIKNNYIRPEKQIWCDLGCGTGIFTLALAKLLPPESIIYATDTNKSDLDSIPERYQNINIRKLSTDFIKDDFPFSNLDGILMANSLHFVSDKLSFIHKIENYVKSNFHFLIVEYDNKTPNAYVPYPLSFQSFQNLFKQNGYNKIIKLNKRNSIYHPSGMYSALASK